MNITMLEELLAESSTAQATPSLEQRRSSPALHSQALTLLVTATENARNLLAQAAPQKTLLGDSGNTGYWPNLPNSGNSVPNGDVPNSSGYNYPYSTDPVVSQLTQILSDMDNASGVGRLFEGQVLMQYLMNLSQQGLLSGPNADPQLAAFLNQTLNGSTISSQISSIISTVMPQAAEAIYFQGYDGLQGSAAVNAWIANIAPIIGTNNPFATQMQQALGMFQSNLPAFDAEHYVNGQYIWNPATDGSSPISTNYIWSDGTDSQNMILGFIANQGQTSTPDPFWSNFSFNELQKDYRVQMLQQILAEFKDPLMAVTIFILMAYDGNYQTQLNGFANTTNDLSSLTNKITTILNDFQKSGTSGMTPAIAAEIKQNLYDVMYTISGQTNTQSLSQDFYTNVFQAIGDTTVQVGTDAKGNPVDDTLYNIMQGGTNPATGKQYTTQDLANAFNQLNPPPSGSTPNQPPTQLQAILSALQSGSTLVSQQSKTVSTLSASVTNTDNQCIKVANFATDPSSGGIGGFMNYLASHQISN